jgi:hypothetical protein
MSENERDPFNGFDEVEADDGELRVSVNVDTTDEYEYEGVSIDQIVIDAATVVDLERDEDGINFVEVETGSESVFRFMRSGNVFEVFDDEREAVGTFERFRPIDDTEVDV